MRTEEAAHGGIARIASITHRDIGRTQGRQTGRRGQTRRQSETAKQPPHRLGDPLSLGGNPN